MTRSNRYLEAFKETFNAMGLATAVAVSFALLNPLPLLAGLVAEAAYLMTVPDSKWYEARLSKRFDADVERRRQKMKDDIMPTLSPAMMARFARLEDTRRQIDVQSQDDKTWFREVLRKLDYLLEKFLVFASKESQFRTYLTALQDELHGAPVRPSEDVVVHDKRASRGRYQPPPLSIQTGVPDDQWVTRAVTEVQSHYEDERAAIEKQLANEQDDNTKAVLEKRMDVLQRRSEFVAKIGKILGNIYHQLQLLEDTFGLINDEVRARSPEQILADIDEVVVATDSMSSALEELAPYEQLTARVA